MTYKDAKVGRTIVSKYGTRWKIVWSYGRDFKIIKREDNGVACAITGGQFRLFKLVE
jgi:hypothetical protein